ncbi:aryl-alcohol dehydrogenase-like predicted oxidoreductase [Paenibacillus taihuensis]|uniref:Aryl-alcohol dehydrogenase-like predicted oxidoreductase n=1 Tax=Paenibacillus taihuensis TaxID=1156355 RepID=A0A3D9R5H2_9BACL|nr:aldo/keto reductase [Paenibacillus taihuensis]REE69659.1 aryl-alcohol dehydrogenase-like predicted oxidoreductase [Paenibacillus taihuensis]
MNYRRLGNSGLRVSELGLGTNAFGKRADRDTSIRIIDFAIDHGINFIDTANIYAGTESERIIGEALQGKRSKVVLATKGGLPRGSGPNESGSSRYHLQQELEDSLKRLQTDYVDLYQIHTFDPSTPLEETLRFLDDMVSSGKIRYIGASNYFAWELMKSLAISEAKGFPRYVATQVSYSLADRTPEQELAPLCIDQGVGIIPYFPLAGGILSGKYSLNVNAPQGSRVVTDPSFSRFLDEGRIKLGQEVSSIAESCGCTASVLSLAWLMSRQTVATVIVGATSTTQLEDNLNSVSVQITGDVIKQLDEISDTYRYGKPFAWYRLP